MAALYDFGARALRHVYDRKIRSAAVLDAASLFPDARRFTADWRTIRDEALEVARDLPRIPRFHDIMREQADISANDNRDWRMFIMQAYGVRFERNRSRCPASPRSSTPAPTCCPPRCRFSRRANTFRRIAGRFAACCAAISCCRCRAARTAAPRPC